MLLTHTHPSRDPPSRHRCLRPPRWRHHRVPAIHGNQRADSVRTHEARLAAIHPFFSYISYQHPQHLNLIARVLAILAKKTTRMILTRLSDPEVEALLRPPDQDTRTGRRYHAITATLIATGLARW